MPGGPVSCTALNVWNCAHAKWRPAVLLENIGETLDAALEPLLLKQTFKSMGVTCIRLGDTTIEYSSDFRWGVLRHGAERARLGKPHGLDSAASLAVTFAPFAPEHGRQSRPLNHRRVPVWQAPRTHSDAT